MFWKILIVFELVSTVLLYLVIVGVNKCKTPKEREEEDYLQMLALQRQKGKKDEKSNNSREAECCERISENLKRMYEE